MNKYEIYQVGKLPPLTVVEASYYCIENEFINFYAQREDEKCFHCIACFVLRNIAGFKKERNDEN